MDRENRAQGFLLFPLIFAVVLVKWGPPTDVYIYLKHLYLAVISLCLSLYLFIEKGSSDKFVVGKSFLFFAAFVGFSSLSLFWSPNKYFAYKNIFFLWSLFIIYTAVINMADEQEIGYGLKLMIAFGVLLALHDILTVKGGIFSERLKHIATLGNPGYIGEYLIFGSSVCLGSIAADGIDRRKKAVYLIVFSFLFFSILLTQTRNSILALFAVTAVLFYKVYQKRSLDAAKFLSAAVVLALIIAIAIPGKGYLSRFTNELGGKSSEARIAKGTATSTAAGRFVIYKESLAMIRDHLLGGVGTGNFSVVYPHYKKAIRNTREQSTKIYTAHSEIINFAAENGLLGLFFILALFFYISIPLIADKFKRYANEAVALPLLAAFIATISISLFGFNLHRPEYASVFIVCLGLFDIINKPRRAVINRKFLYLALFAAIVISFMAVIFNLNITKGEIELDKGIFLYTVRHDPPRAITFFEKAYQYNPDEEKLPFYIGTSYMAMGDYRKAGEFFKRGLDLYPYEQRYYANYAAALLKQERYKEAEEVLSDCISKIPTSYLAYNKLAVIYREVYHDEAKAQESLDKSTRINPFQKL